MHKLLIALFGALLTLQNISAADLEILVAPKKSDAYSYAKTKQDKKSVFAERKLFKAFNRAAEHLNKCGGCTVNIKIAGGEYLGKGKTGNWKFPEVKSPKSTLRLLGGYNDDFSHRQPFERLTKLVSSKHRVNPVFHMLGKKHALKEFWFSGFALDVAPGNKYGGALSKGGSSSDRIVAFGYMTIDKMVIADNIFMNAAHGAGEPLVRPMSKQAQVILRNNIFLNNVLTWRVKSPYTSIMLKRYLVENNSFILGWPYNPDPSTSNPGTLEIGAKNTAELVEIKGNLFAYNVGGAVFPQWDDTKGPKIAIHNNLFWGNGSLFGVTEPDTAAVVGKFNGAGIYGTFSSEDVEDDFEWDVHDNHAFDPKIRVQRSEFKPVEYAGNGVKERRLSASTVKVEVSEELSELEQLEARLTAEAEASESLDDEDAELMAELDELGGDEPIASVDEEDEVSEESDLAMDDGLDELSMEEDVVTSRGYAPRLYLDANRLPFPANDEAKPFGASQNLVEQF